MVSRKDRISRKNREAFPNYRPVHEVYLEQIGRFCSDRPVILHLGAGRDLTAVRDRVLRRAVLVSLDLDRMALCLNANSLRVNGDAAALPFRPQTFDIILAENVFEHLEFPLVVLQECQRVLRPGGRLMFFCPNGASYIAVLSRPTPHWMHVKLKRLLGNETAELDTYPVYYRLNTLASIRRNAEGAGFDVEQLESFVGWPSYWEFSELLHNLAIWLHRLLERYEFLRPFHITLLGVLRKRP